MDISKETLTSAVRKTVVVYPDGVELEFRVRLPASSGTVQVVFRAIPDDAWLTATYTDDEGDGFTYSYASYWIPCTLNCASCGVPATGVTIAPCKLVRA
jgi:hypothetical protein